MAKFRIPFSIKSITTDEFATIDSCYDPLSKVGINTEYGFGINKEENALAVKMSVTLSCEKGTFIILKVICEFEIEEDAFKKFYSKTEKSYHVPKGFFTHLCVITVGTVRGILHARLANTNYKQYLLPSLDLSELIQKDVEFE